MAFKGLGLYMDIKHIWKMVPLVEMIARISNDLPQVEVPVVSDEDCNASYGAAG